MSIAEAIRILAGKTAELYCKICTVDAVDETARTVDVSPIDESAPILGVNLQANQNAEVGLVLLPKQGSHVVVAFLSQATAVVVLTEVVEKVLLKLGEDKPAELTIADGTVLLKVGDTTAEISAEKKITLNGGENGGLIVVGNLTDKLNALKDTVNSLANAFNSHIHTTTATIGTTPTVGVIAPPTTQAQTAQAFDKADYENENITH